ncbi:MAG: hypothetical protein IK130_00445 [Oscillospiraceae bacterium]|nr:hypothetical protein [Oscillospiraceae bacterium]
MKYAGCLREPVPANAAEQVYRIVLDETDSGTYIYLYCSPDAEEASYDEWYPDTETARAVWTPLIDEKGWIPLN